MTAPTPSFVFGDQLRRWTSYSADLESALSDADLQGLNIEHAVVLALVYFEDHWWYVLDAADIYGRPISLPATVVDAAFEVTNRVELPTIHRRNGETAPHGPFRARGAVIEIIESGAKTSDEDAATSVIAPNDIRINGQSLLAPDDAPVTVHTLAAHPGELVRVTLTLFARRVSIRAEHDTEA